MLWRNLRCQYPFFRDSGVFLFVLFFVFSFLMYVVGVGEEVEGFGVGVRCISCEVK